MKKIITVFTLLMAFCLFAPTIEAKKSRSGKARATTSTTKRQSAKKIMAIQGYNPDVYLFSNGKVSWMGKQCGEWKNVPGAILVEMYLWNGIPDNEGANISGFIIGNTFYQVFVGSEEYDYIEYDPERQIFYYGNNDDDDITQFKISDYKPGSWLESYKVIRY